MTTQTLLEATAANKLQTRWMEFNSANATRAEIDKMCKDYSVLPNSYIAQADDGRCQVLIQGMPTTADNVSIQDAEWIANKHNIQTQLRWNTKGFWFNA